jgi:hypothetical protein
LFTWPVHHHHRLLPGALLYQDALANGRVGITPPP